MAEDSLADKMAQDAIINQLNRQANQKRSDLTPYGSESGAPLNLLGAGQTYGAAA